MFLPNAYKFVREVMKYLAMRKGIDWTPGSLKDYLERRVPDWNDALLLQVTEVAQAVHKISLLEPNINDKEFDFLLHNIGQTRYDFASALGLSTAERYYPSYSRFNPFNFIRYLSYLMSFSMYCYEKGAIGIPDFVSFSILRTISKKINVFRSTVAWQMLHNEAKRINSTEFVNLELS